MHGRFVKTNLIKVIGKFQVPPVYGLDATDVMQWDSLVRDVAFNVIDGFIHGVDEKVVPLFSTFT